ncbi:unnamed protein product [Peronospora belbahrii]|uniref:C3H1-type domain-containing protein n=1 Tax=Peronospora belbahrii TaxID=622444 RepID=A0ABN8CWK8_9STRA|nr:unnamed protein product [Peronospora belbahrii]
MKFRSGYGCSYGTKCRFSHDLQAFSPFYYESPRYDDMISSTTYAMPHQNYTQRQMMNPHWVSKNDSPQHSAVFHVTPQREQASSFANYSKSYGSRSDIVSVSPRGKLLYKEAIVKQSKAKHPLERKHHDSVTHESRQENKSNDASSLFNNEKVTDRTESPDKPFSRHHQRRKNLCPRKCGMLNSADGTLTELHRDPNYLLSEVSNANVARTKYEQQQQPQRKEQQIYLHPPRAAQVMHPMSPSYARYLAEEQFHSHVSRQVETFIDYIDTKLASMKMHQQQAIDLLQELARSLWPDALVDVYGSSYTHLALPASDIDCVLVSKSLVGERPLAILKTLLAKVERQPWTKRLELLGSAKIPVLKMTNSLDPTQLDVLLDVTCGHSVGHTGLDARNLIYSLQAEMPALRPLVLVLKSHLVSHDLNCAFTGGISSYVLVIMVIRFLQACGNTHCKSFAESNMCRVRSGNRRRSYSDNATVYGVPEELAYISSLYDAVVHPRWRYTFSRNGRVTWRTGVGSLLLLFLETYITFDYRRFGISIDKEGEFFLLPPDKAVPMQCSVVIPYVADPIKPGRSICNCFRMHEVIQSWHGLYQNLLAGVPVTACIGGGLTP